MRYIVVPRTMDKNHPQWPNEELYFIKDLHTGLTSFSCYTKLDVAEEIVKRKNTDR